MPHTALAFTDLSPEAQALLLMLKDFDKDFVPFPGLALQESSQILIHAMDIMGQGPVLEVMKYMAEGQEELEKIINASDEEIDQMLIAADIDPNDESTAVVLRKALLRSAFASKNRGAVKNLQPK